MKSRILPMLSLLTALAVLISGGSALAGIEVPLSTVRWSLGDPSPFAATRFDAQYDEATGRIYFLGFRTTGDVTDGPSGTTT